VSFLNYAKGLSFEEKPDYEYLFKLLRQSVYTDKQYKSKIFDWITPPVLLLIILEATNY